VTRQKGSCAGRRHVAILAFTLDAVGIYICHVGVGSALLLDGISRSLAASLDEHMSLQAPSALMFIFAAHQFVGQAHLQSVLPAEALVTVSAGEGLDSQVDPLVPLEVVVPVEALRALVTLEGPLSLRHRVVLRVVEMRHVDCGAGVEGILRLVLMMRRVRHRHPMRVILGLQRVHVGRAWQRIGEGSGGREGEGS